MHSAAILAGGRASRFEGRDKGGLLVDGRTIRERQLAVLSRVADDVCIVGGPHGDIPDLVADSGPLGGVHSALVHARHDAVFVVACDMPYVTEALVRRLLDLAGAADAVVPCTATGCHPLCAVYTRACLAPIERRLAARALKMIDLLAEVRTRKVTGEEISDCGDVDRLLANVNTPSDYAALESFRPLRNHKP